jgi:hypothetical protein
MSRQDEKAFFRHVLHTVAPAIADSAYFVAITPPTGSEADVKMAVEVGLAVLMDKPIIVIRSEGRHSDRLCRIADHVIEGDIDTEEGRAKIKDKLKVLAQ